MSKPTPLDLFGLTGLIGGSVTKHAFKFCSLFPHRLCCFFVTPGLYPLCAVVLQRIHHPIALLFSPGVRQNKLILHGLDSWWQLSYVGIHSGTRTQVASPLFEGWIRWQTSKLPLRRAPGSVRTPRRKVDIGFVKCRNKKSAEIRCCAGCDGCSDPELNGTDGRVLSTNSTNPFPMSRMPYLILLQITAALLLVTLVMFYTDFVAIGCIALNMLVYGLLRTTVGTEVCRVATSKQPDGCPPGDAVVCDEYHDNLWLISADEGSLQDLLQRPIGIAQYNSLDVQTPDSHNRSCLEFVQACLAILGCVTAFATILVVPIMSSIGQLIFISEMVVGLLAVFLLSSRNRDQVLYHITEHYFKMSAVQRYTFTCRGAGVAAVAIAAGIQGKNNKKAIGRITTNIGANMVPITGEEWRNYRNALDKIVQHMDGTWDEQTLCRKLDEWSHLVWAEPIRLNQAYASRDDIVEGFTAAYHWAYLGK